MTSKVGLFSFSFSAVLMLLLLLLLLLCAVDAQTVAPFISAVPRDNSTDCIQRGFAGSTLNKCGYCVGGTTGLSLDFGLDCAGTCGLAFTDCAGTCNGQSYQDECTRECIGGNILSNDKTTSKRQVRDCRGLCRLDGLLTSSNKIEFDYVADECGICIARKLQRDGSRQPASQQTIAVNANEAITHTNSTIVKREAGAKQVQKPQNDDPTDRTLSTMKSETSTEKSRNRTRATVTLAARATVTTESSFTPRESSSFPTTTATTETSFNTSPTNATRTSDVTAATTAGTSEGTSRRTTGTATEHSSSTAEMSERTSPTFTSTTGTTSQTSSPTTDTTSPTTETTSQTPLTTNRTHTTATPDRQRHTFPTTLVPEQHTTQTTATPTHQLSSNATTIASSTNVAGSGPTKSNALHAVLSNDSSFNGTVKSAYKDCTGICYAPASAHDMAVVSNETCNQCLSINSWKKLTLRNGCGRCNPDPEPCLCSMTQQDVCGVCNGGNDTCTTIVSAYPANIPSDTATTINAIGVTLKSKYHAVCLLIRRDIQPDGRDEWKFPADVSGTSISCSVTAPEGLYNLHLGVAQENGDVMTYSNKSLPFLVYSKSALISSMSPSTAVIPKAADNSSNGQLTVTFEAHELQRIATLYCTIYGDGYSEPIVTKTTNVTQNKVVCSVPYPLHSSTSNVNVSLDLGGKGFLDGPFPLTFYASPPSITRFVPLPEGDRLAIFFDRDVATATTNATSTNCTRVFAQRSMATLGENSTCVWVTKRQLMVAFGFSNPPVIGQNALSVDAADVILYFNDRAIYADYENYTRPANNMSISFKLSDEPPLAILIGPSGMVPSCGDFILDGHQSAGLHTRRGRYEWSVAVNGSVAANPINSTAMSAVNHGNSTDNVGTNLTRLLKEATNSNMASVIVQSSDMEYDVGYAFSLKVSNGVTSQSPSSTSTLTIVRSRTPLPAIFIEPSVVQYAGRVPVDFRFTLTSKIDMPTCIRELYSIHFRWSTPNPKVKFDILQLNSSVYTVEPYTLPPNENVRFEVKVWLNNDLNLLSRASISFTVDAPKVRAILTGGKQRSLGVNSGLLELNASTSHHSVMPNLPLVYRWECLTEDNNPCYNYDPSVKETQLVASPIDRSSVLSLATNRLRIGDRMTFAVRAFSPINASDVSAPQTVVVQVTNDSAPLVSIEHIVSRRKLGSREPTVDANMRYEVLSDVNVEIVATVHSSSSPIASIKWTIPGFASDLNKYSLREDVSQADQNWTSRSSLVIRKDLLVANGLYEINVTATNEQGHVGWSVSEFVVTSPVSNCRVTVAEYEAFTMTYVYLEGCTASHSSYPLRYEAFVYSKGSPMSISQTGFHLPLAIMGPPAMPSAVRASRDGCGCVEYYNDSTNMFAVEVCDVYANCWLFNGTRTTVRPARDMQAAATHAFAMANIAKLTDNYLSCLRRHAFYLMDAASNPSYLADNDLEFQSQLAQAYVCARKAAEKQCNDSSCFANLFTFLTAIPIDTRTSREFMLTEVLDRALHRIESLNISLTAVAIQEAFIVLEAVYRFNVTDVVAAKTAATMEDRFQRILARSLSIGESPLLTDTFGHPVVAMSYDGLNSTLDVVTNATANSTVTVLFGSDFKSKYNGWKCLEDDQLCRGVVAELQFYPDLVFRNITVDDRPNRTVSDVIKATLLNPATGETVKDKSGTVVLTMPVDRLRMSQDLEYECHFWDVDDETWSRTGMKTSDGGGMTLDCESDHLATFVVIGSEPTMSAWLIAVIVVSCVVVLILLAGGGFYFYRKSRTKTMRVSIGRGGYHPNGQ